MTLIEYQKQAKRTLGNITMQNILMGIFGEAGEVVDYLKKVIYHGHPLEKEKMVEELGDLLWYVVAPYSAQGVHTKGFKPVERIDGWLIESLEPYGLARLLMAETSKMILEVDSWKDYVSTGYVDHAMAVIHELAKRVGSSLPEVSSYNIKKLKRRYPNGFEKRRSTNRR